MSQWDTDQRAIEIAQMDETASGAPSQSSSTHLSRPVATNTVS